MLVKDKFPESARKVRIARDHTGPFSTLTFLWVGMDTGWSIAE